jgi:hypothetical protein
MAKRCKGKLKGSETRCSRAPGEGSDYCATHDPGRHTLRLWSAMEETRLRAANYDKLLKLMKRIAAGRSKDPQHDAEMLLTEIA